MAAWNFDQFTKNIENNRPAPFYLFFGSEIFLAEEAFKKLKNKIFETSLVDFNFDVFYGEDFDFEKLSAVVETLPMMGEQRLVVLKNAHLLKTSDLEKISEVVSVPIDTTVFLMIFESIDQRKKIFKDFFKKTTVVEFSEIQERSIPSWIQKMSLGFNKKIHPQASLALQNLVGNRLIDLHNEINKLSLYVGERTNIEVSDIEAVVSKYKMDSVFELTNAVAAKQTEKAFKIQKYLLDQGESEVGILAMMTRHMRIMLLTQEALGRRLYGPSLAQYIGVPPYFMNQYVEHARLWSKEKLQKSYKKLLSTDRSLKSSSIPSENYIVDVLSYLTQAP